MSQRAKQRRPAGRGGTGWWSYGILGGLIGAALVALALTNGGTLAWQRPVASKLTLADIPFNGERAFGYLKELCAIGPRVSGTEGMRQQQAYLKAHFERLGGRVTLQEFDARHPLDGKPVRMGNLLVEWHPEKRDRILLAAHYDTRPFPDQDPVDPKGVFVGANDGASGTALLCELAHAMRDLKCAYGVDFVLFDGEELVYDGQRDPYFLGSEHFAREYASQPPAHRYQKGVLLDMVADRYLEIYREVNSMQTPKTRQIVHEIWETARNLGVREFIHQTRHEIRDDHLPLNQIARIPTIDIIDFDYPTARGPNYWHTTQDVPENCSALSLAKVGWVLKTWLEKTR